MAAARGLDPAAIGIVLAAMQAVRVVATPAGTRLADRYGSLRGAIVVSAVASVGGDGAARHAPGFTFVLVAAVAVAFVSAPVLPLTDAYALKGLAAARPRLRAGAAVGLGRVHRGEPHRRRAAGYPCAPAI